MSEIVKTGIRWVIDMMAMILILLYIFCADEIYRIQYFDRVLIAVLLCIYLRLFWLGVKQEK